MRVICIDNHSRYKFPITIGKEYDVLNTGRDGSV